MKKIGEKQTFIEFLKEAAVTSCRIVAVMLAALLVSVLLVPLYRMCFSENNRSGECLFVGAGSVMAEVVFSFFVFKNYGYEQKNTRRSAFVFQLSGGAVLHFLVSLPFHFSMYTAGAAVAKLTEWLYFKIRPEEAGGQASFTDIPVYWLMLAFWIVEAVVLLAGFGGFESGMAKRKKESEKVRENR